MPDTDTRRWNAKKRQGHRRRIQKVNRRFRAEERRRAQLLKIKPPQRLD